jgi:PAS domain S-box-containing protein
MHHDRRRPGMEGQTLSTVELCIQAFDAELDYVFASLRRLGARSSELEDLAHQVFLVLLRSWRAFPDRRALQLHLFSLAVRVLERQRRDLAVTRVERGEPLPLALMALERLPLRRRAVLVLHELDQVPVDAIAGSLSMTRLGVALRLRKARRDLVAAIRQLVARRQAGPLGCLDLLLAQAEVRAELLKTTHDTEQPGEVVGEILQLQDDVFLLEAMMDDLPDTIYFKDRQSRFTRINRYAAAHYGIFNPALAVGRTDFDFFTEEHAGQALRDEQQIIRTGLPLVGIEEKETLPDGKSRWVSTTKLPLRDQDGDIVGILGLSRDITERKRVA